LTDGELPGCLTPAGPSKTLYHAKPLIIQAALLAARQAGNLSLFAEYGNQMRALLGYWNSSSRRDAATGLHMWHDQLETGADNLVFSECPSQFSPECWSDSQAYTLAAPDVMVWLAREYEAYALFLEGWRHSGGGGLSWEAERDAAARYGAALRDVIHARLWRWLDAPACTRGLYVAFNVSTGAQIARRTYQAAWPVWAGLAANESVKQAALTALLEADLWSPFGVRSAASTDPLYNNANIINPYSNWRGPIWVNVNAVMAYTLRASGLAPAAGALADTIVRVLAADLRANGQWHEAYNADNGTALAAPGFLSWNTLGADLQANVAEGRDPFSLK
jgi:glycogen debranching enzyme